MAFLGTTSAAISSIVGNNFNIYPKSNILLKLMCENLVGMNYL